VKTRGHSAAVYVDNSGGRSLYVDNVAQSIKLHRKWQAGPIVVSIPAVDVISIVFLNASGGDPVLSTRGALTVMLKDRYLEYSYSGNPNFDYKLTRGLCGLWNGDGADDLIDSFGTLRNSSAQADVNAFSISWGRAASSSVFSSMPGNSEAASLCGVAASPIAPPPPVDPVAVSCCGSRNLSATANAACTVDLTTFILADASHRSSNCARYAAIGTTPILCSCSGNGLCRLTASGSTRCDCFPEYVGDRCQSFQRTYTFVLLFVAHVHDVKRTQPCHQLCCFPHNRIV